MKNVLCFVILSVLSVSAQASIDPIEKELTSKKFKCMTIEASKKPWDFDLSFYTARVGGRHKRTRLFARFTGKFSNGKSEAEMVETTRDSYAVASFIDRAQKTFDLEVSDPGPFIFHRGRPRNFDAHLSFGADFSSAHGKLSYTVGNKRSGKKHYVRQISCVLAQ